MVFSHIILWFFLSHLLSVNPIEGHFFLNILPSLESLEMSTVLLTDSKYIYFSSPIFIKVGRGSHVQSMASFYRITFILPQIVSSSVKILSVISYHIKWPLWHNRLVLFFYFYFFFFCNGIILFFNILVCFSKTTLAIPMQNQISVSHFPTSVKTVPRHLNLFACLILVNRPSQKKHSCLINLKRQQRYVPNYA